MPMLQTQIVEHAGVLLWVEYDDVSPPTFNTVRVLDGEYRPVGPNLVPLLNDLVLILKPEAQVGEEVEAERFLSNILTEMGQ
jgi:hypothetical protein